MFDRTPKPNGKVRWHVQTIFWPIQSRCFFCMFPCLFLCGLCSKSMITAPGTGKGCRKNDVQFESFLVINYVICFCWTKIWKFPCNKPCHMFPATKSRYIVLYTFENCNSITIKVLNINTFFSQAHQVKWHKIVEIVSNHDEYEINLTSFLDRYVNHWFEKTYARETSRFSRIVMLLYHLDDMSQEDISIQNQYST